jgi:hypothetical protein
MPFLPDRGFVVRILGRDVRLFLTEDEYQSVHSDVAMLRES